MSLLVKVPGIFSFLTSNFVLDLRSVNTTVLFVAVKEDNGSGFNGLLYVFCLVIYTYSFYSFFFCIFLFLHSLRLTLCIESMYVMRILGSRWC